MIKNAALSDDNFGASDPIFRKEVGEYLTQDQQRDVRIRFDKKAKALFEKRFTQDVATVEMLRSKYKTPIFGEMYMYDALLRLGECVDPTDTELYCTSQLVHCLQVAESMEKSGVTDETLILAALIHDLGKLTDLVGEVPEYVNGPNEPVGNNIIGCGLDNTMIMWNHDEFAYERIKDYVPDHVSWIVRYHSLRFDVAQDFMDSRDWAYYDQYLSVFRKYDLGTKSTFYYPDKKLSDYRDLIEKYFPKKILI